MFYKFSLSLIVVTLTHVLSSFGQDFNSYIASTNRKTQTILKVDNCGYDKWSTSSENLTYVLQEANKPHPLVKVGKILTFIGLPLGIIGGIMVANADEYHYTCVNGDCEGDAGGAFGAVMLASGIGMSGTGVILWTIGSKK